MKSRLTTEEKAAIAAIQSDYMTGGATLSAPVDPDWFKLYLDTPEEREVQHFCFCMTYLDTLFYEWEPVNTIFFEFVETETQGIIKVPAQHGKTTMLGAIQIMRMVKEPEIAMIYTEKNLPTAQKRARGVRMQLEENLLLQQHFGIFTPPPRSSKPWSDEQFTINQRKVISQWPTLAVYGAGGGSALGNRCNCLFVDDPVTHENSRSETERDNLKQWYDEAASTCPVPLRAVKIRAYIKQIFLIGTVFMVDDLFDREEKSGEYKVLHLKAVMDEASGECLAPSRYAWIDREILNERALVDNYYTQLKYKIENKEIINLWAYAKRAGRRAFNRRYQNVVAKSEGGWVQEDWIRGGPSTLPYAPPEGYAGCLDENRSIGEVDPNWILVTGVDPAGEGNRKNKSANFAYITQGIDPKEPHIRYLVDMGYGKYELDSEMPGRTTQAGLVLDQVKKYGSRIIVENNAQQGVWLSVIRNRASREGISLSIQGHYTGSQKFDPEVGVLAMGPMIENGHLRLPYAHASDRALVDKLLDEMLYWGAYPTKDLVMALWFGWCRMNDIAKAQVFDNSNVLPQMPDYVEWKTGWWFPEDMSEEQRMDFLRKVGPA